MACDRSWPTSTPASRFTGEPVSANAYLGGWGIAAALGAGADVVVCPRVTDASLVVGPAAWWWGWASDDWNALAGAVVAGHVIECGAQTTGGNYSFFEQIPDLSRHRASRSPRSTTTVRASSPSIRAPAALVSVGTVTAQLLYEIGGPAYLNPDVVADFGTIRLDRRRSGPGADRRRAGAARAADDQGVHQLRRRLPQPHDLRAHRAWPRQKRLRGPRPRCSPDSVARNASTRSTCASWRRHPMPTARRLRRAGCTSASNQPTTVPSVERSHRRAIELALANYPGFFVSSPPTDAQPFGVYWPALVPNDEVHQVVVLGDGRRLAIEPSPASADVPLAAVPDAQLAPVTDVGGVAPSGPDLASRSACISAPVRETRAATPTSASGPRDAAGYAWLAANLTAESITDLIPEAAGLEVSRYELPNLLALNFVIVGYLGEGVASSTAFDAQAKGLGEYCAVGLWSGRQPTCSGRWTPTAGPTV